MSDSRFKPSEEVLDLGCLTNSPNLIDRATGKSVCAAVLAELEQLAPQGLLILDCCGVQSASYSGLSAMALVFLPPRARELQDRYLMVKVESHQSDFSEAVEHVAREQGIVIPAIDDQGNLFVFGRLTVADTEALEAVWNAGNTGGLTASVFADRLSVVIAATSKRLKHLFDRRLVRREERVRPLGGREFVYLPLSRNTHF
jgi:hypothetical protein